MSVCLQVVFQPSHSSSSHRSSHKEHPQVELLFQTNHSQAKTILSIRSTTIKACSCQIQQIKFYLLLNPFLMILALFEVHRRRLESLDSTIDFFTVNWMQITYLQLTRIISSSHLCSFSMLNSSRLNL